MRLSVILPCLNGRQTIAVQLDALARQEWSAPWEILFCDNGSTDGTLDIVGEYQERLPNLRVVDASARRGKPYALNTGVQAATGEALVFCDADDEVGAGWLAAMGEALTKYDFVACRVDITKLNAPWVQASRGAFQSKELSRSSIGLYHAGGGTMGIKRALYQAVGGADESMHVLDDTDLCWRVQKEGVELHFVPDAVLHVRLRDTYRGMYHQASAWARDYTWLHKKHDLLGAPEYKRRGSASAWIKLLIKLPRAVRSKAGFGRWIWQFGWFAGELQGMVRYRLLAP